MTIFKDIKYCEVLTLRGGQNNWQQPPADLLRLEEDLYYYSNPSFLAHSFRVEENLYYGNPYFEDIPCGERVNFNIHRSLIKTFARSIRVEEDLFYHHHHHILIGHRHHLQDYLHWVLLGALDDI